MIYLLDTDMLIFMVRGLKSAKHPKNHQRPGTRRALPEHAGRR